MIVAAVIFNREPTALVTSSRSPEASTMRDTPADRKRSQRARDLGANFVGEGQVAAMAPSIATATTTAPSSFLIPATGCRRHRRYCVADVT